MKARWVWAGVLALAVTGGVFWFKRPREAAAEYRTARVDRGSIVATVSATGTVKPVTMVQVGSQVSGTVLSLHADFNSRVRKDEVVARLDPSMFRTQMAQAEATLTRAEVNVADAERTLRRSKDLLERNLVSQADVDGAQAALDRSSAEVKQARAAVDQARVNLGHTTIASPIDGVVVARNVDVGQTVAASLQAPVLFEIANDLTDMQVEASVDEADIGRVAPGQAVRFTVDAFPDESFAGVVAQIRLQAITVQNVVTYTTVIAVKNPELKLRPGMTANVSIEVARRDDVLRVPSGALGFRPPEKSGKKGKAVAAGVAVAGPTGSARGAAPASSAGDSTRGSRRGAGGPGGPGSGAVDRGAAPGRSASGVAGGANGTSGAAGGRAAGPTVYLKGDGVDPRPVRVRSGITDGYFTEVLSPELREGDEVIVGLASSARGAGAAGGPGGQQNRSPLSSGPRRGPF